MFSRWSYFASHRSLIKSKQHVSFVKTLFIIRELRLSLIFLQLSTSYILSPVLIGERGFLLQESYACDTDTLHHCWLTVLQKLSRSSLLSPGFDGLIKTSIIIWDKNYIFLEFCNIQQSKTFKKKYWFNEKDAVSINLFFT